MAIDIENDDLFDNHAVNYIEERNILLKDIPYDRVRKAWFTMAHVLIDENAKILDMGCGDGEQTYIMAALYPKLTFVGIDKDSRVISTAQETYKLPNLEFRAGDVTSDLFEPESIDVILNSFVLHHVFSNSRYNDKIISDTLRKQFKMLKNGGTMYLRDYARPPEGQFILMEMHDKKSTGESLKELSDPDLLIWYSENARPKQDIGCGGFFLEELQPRFPKTRLFRLPYKWAYEFIMRKDNREIWEKELPVEYTYYTAKDFRKELRSLGARVQYSASHWDEDFIRQNVEGHFRLMHLNGEVLNDPETSFIAVAQKEPERSSLVIRERRIVQDEDGALKIKSMRDQKNGDLIDIVTRDMEYAEILPYRLSQDGRLFVYLHDGVVRGISNAVQRSGASIDGREWSGHMLEAITFPYEDINNLDTTSPDAAQSIAKSHLGIKIAPNTILEEGAQYYPDPNYIEERVHTFFIKTQDTHKHIAPKRSILEPLRFQAKSVIRECNAQHVLDAISVGLIPNARLELQILSLMQKLKVRSENWVSKDLSIAQGTISQDFDVREFIRQSTYSDKRFKIAKASANELRTVNSVFVEDGYSQGGSAGIASENIDFVLSNNKTTNTAVVLPISSSMKKDINAGFQIKHMPVPERFEGKGQSLSVPQFNIPREITTHKMLKHYIAEKFGVTPNMVMKLGESYFTHVGITPQRIYPFAIAAPPDMLRDPDTKFIPIYQFMLLWQSLSKETHFLVTLARAYQYLPEHFKFEFKKQSMDLGDFLKAEALKPSWSAPQDVEPIEDTTRPHYDLKPPASHTFNTSNNGFGEKLAGYAPRKPNMPTRPELMFRDAFADKTNTPAPINDVPAIAPHEKKVKKKKAERKRRRLMGLLNKKDVPDTLESKDAESLEAQNQKKKSNQDIDVNLLNDFDVGIKHDDAPNIAPDADDDHEPRPS